jgi:hypothetical protein
VLHGPKVGGYSFRLDELGITHVVTLLNDQSEEKKARVHTLTFTHMHQLPWSLTVVMVGVSGGRAPG